MDYKALPKVYPHFPTIGKSTTHIYNLSVVFDRYNNPQMFRCKCGAEAWYGVSYISPIDECMRDYYICVRCLKVAYPWHSFARCYFYNNRHTTLNDAVTIRDKYYRDIYPDVRFTPVYCEVGDTSHWHLEEY